MLQNMQYRWIFPGAIALTLAACGDEGPDPQITPEMAGIWEGTTTDSVTGLPAEAFMFTADDGKLILASREATSLEGTMNRTLLNLEGSVTASTADGQTFLDGSDSSECAFFARFETHTDIVGNYNCPTGDGGVFAVARISPLASELDD